MRYGRYNNYGIISITILAFVATIFLLPNGNSIEIHYTPSHSYIFENDQRAQQEIIFDDQNATNIIQSQTIRIYVNFQEKMTNISIESYLYLYESLHDSEILNYSGNGRYDAYITLRISDLNISVNKSLANIPIRSAIWINYSNSNMTDRITMEKNYTFVRTYSVLNIKYAKYLENGIDSTIEVNVETTRELNNFKFRVLSDLFNPQEIFYKNLSPGYYKLSFNILFPDDMNRTISFRYEISSTDAETNSSLYSYFNDPQQFVIHVMNSDPNKSDEINSDNKYQNLLIYVALIIIIFLGISGILYFFIINKSDTRLRR